MIVRSVRLKNIKSYGTGDTGEGVTVVFAPGVNRIAGRNGHGKSTLIEAIGYALFLVTPDFAETFAAETYLLRSGAKEGEIDVTFEHSGSAYRLERGVGKSSKRRSKAIDLTEESICAEGDKEVTDFLCRLLGLPTSKHLEEVFSKLIGVKQGRLTRPFDSKPAEAKRFFEPLFDVSIFRECHDKLKPARDLFNGRISEERERKAGIDQRIGDRADSKRQLATAEETIKKQQGDFDAARKARDAAKANKKKHEQLSQSRAEAEKQRDQAKSGLEVAAERLEMAKDRLKEAEEAVAMAKATRVAHENFQEANRQLIKLEEKRVERDGLKEKRSTVESERKEYESDAKSARSQAGNYSEQKAKKLEDCNEVDRNLAALDKDLSDSQRAFGDAEKSFSEVGELHSSLQLWISGLSGSVGRVQSGVEGIVQLREEIATWKPKTLQQAESVHAKAQKAQEEASTKLAKSKERRITMKAQLDQIAGGICPFLKESCRQFDPAKVQADLSALEEEIADDQKLVFKSEEAFKETYKSLKAQQKQQTQWESKQESIDSNLKPFQIELEALLLENLGDAVTRLRAWDERIEAFPKTPSIPESVEPERVIQIAESVSIFASKAIEWWQQVDEVFDEREVAQHKARQERTRQEEKLKQLRSQKENLTKEINHLSSNVETKLAEAKKLDEEAAKSLNWVKGFDQQLKAYASLEDDLKIQRKSQKEHSEGHEKYLQARKLADALDERKQGVTEAEGKHKEADNKLKVAQLKFAEADKIFDLDALARAIEDYETKSKEVTTIETDLKHEQETKKREETRFQEWQQACRDLALVEAEIDRLEASMEITDLARKVLQNAAPAVAQHLCDRIAGRAQTVFNHINPDPVELAWDAKRYSLRIVPGDRRFAMLSGGEQTKLALALTLAMIEEFGGLRFCIFDEPTYGVDADSRQKLADAIIEVQSAAKLEQLLLVSHDDAFEGKIEHAILLNKSARTGSAVSKEE